jgi:hypothetical protein
LTETRRHQCVPTNANTSALPPPRQVHMDIYPSTRYTAVPTSINTDVCLPRQVANKTYRLRLRLPLESIVIYVCILWCLLLRM